MSPPQDIATHTRNNGHGHTLVQVLHLWDLHGHLLSSMSTSHTKNCTCGNSTGDCTVWTMRARHDGEIDDHRRTATAEPLQFFYTVQLQAPVVVNNGPVVSVSRTANHLGSCTTCITGTSTTKYELGKHYGLLNSKTMGIGLCIATGNRRPARNCDCGNPQFAARRNLTFLLVHTGRDAEHLGPEDREGNTAKGAESPAKPAKHATNVDVTALLVQNCHDAEHHGPVNDNRKEHSARSIVTSKNQPTA